MWKQRFLELAIFAQKAPPAWAGCREHPAYLFYWIVSSRKAIAMLSVIE
jgi:hypothetical protein